MKKLFITLSAAAALFLAGCDNENTVNPEPTETTTITGTISADIDQEPDDEDFEPLEIVTGTKTPLNVYVKDHATGALLGKHENITNGKYRVEVPVGAPRDLDIVLSNFEIDLTVNLDGDFKSYPYIYSSDAVKASVTDAVKGATYIKDIVLSATEDNNEDTPSDFTRVTYE